MEHFNQQTGKPDLFNVLEALKTNITYGLNCVKVASVVSFDADNMISCCQVKNKRLLNIKKDGNQELIDYPLIYAKTYFLGYGDIGITHPIVTGAEGILLFNDREIETWFTTGEAGNIAYDRCHDLSDAIFICGLCSQPNLNLLQYLETALMIYYKTQNIQLTETGIIINGNTTINGNLLVNGSIEATGDIVANGISLLNHFHKYNNNPTTKPEGNIT